MYLFEAKSYMNTDNFIKFSKPFMNALNDIFETMVSDTLVAGQPEVKETNRSCCDITSTMRMSGVIESNDGESKSFQGLVCLCFPRETYIAISNKMLGESYTDIVDDIKDVGNEINNMMVGNAKASLNSQGYKIDMLIPSIIFGKGREIGYPAGTTTVIIPMNSECGKFFVEICYQE